ncbi:UGMP family protein [Candidatus Pacearchaeota archaeon]|nr:UGMP family protein [Candidatus Pacearchaeota archaeon]
MVIVGIESTAHTFGVGVVRNGKILSNCKNSYTTESGGIIPMDSAKHHKDCANDVWNESLDKACVSENDISGISFSQSPGLSPCLIEGMNFAKTKAHELGVCLIPVNHCVAHLEIGRLTGAKDPVLLYASGANTQIISYTAGESPRMPENPKKEKQEFSGVAGKYRVFGETLDIGIGNFIDTFARHIGLGFPGGPKIQKLAETGKYIEVPYTIKGMDVAFSGLLTNLKQKYDTRRTSSSVSSNSKNKKEFVDKGISKEDLSYSLQETAFAMLIEATERALAHTGKKELLLGGGVGCNTRLQEMCRIMCKERGAKFFVPDNSLLVDNGAMIAYLGEIMFKSGIKFLGNDIDKLDIDPRERTDMVDVRWR